MNKHIKKQLLDRDRRLYYDFLPDMESIVEKPANTITTIILYTCFALIVTTFIWASKCGLDVAITATGNVDTVEAMVAPVYMTSGVIMEVCLNDGDHVEPGSIICRLDTSHDEFTLREYEYNLEVLNVQKELYEELYEMYKTGEVVPLEADISKYGENEKIAEAIILENELYLNDLKDLDDEGRTMAVNERLYSITTNINKIDTQIEKLELQIESYTKEMENMTVVSTVSGTIHFAEKMYAGKTVRAGDTVCYITETENEYVFTAYVADEDITRFNIGNAVKLKLPAFDDTEYEYISGKVISVSDVPISISDRGVVYVVKITPEVVPKDFKTGMEGSVDIIVGTRTVMDYFLEPFKKGLSNSIIDK